MSIYVLRGVCSLWGSDIPRRSGHRVGVILANKCMEHSIVGRREPGLMTVVRVSSNMSPVHASPAAVLHRWSAGVGLSAQGTDGQICWKCYRRLSPYDVIVGYTPYDAAGSVATCTRMYCGSLEILCRFHHCSVRPRRAMLLITFRLT